MKHTIQVMHSVVQNSDQGVIDGIRDIFKKNIRSFLLKYRLNAMLDHIGILVMLDLIENDIYQLSLGEN